ncbi:MAG TPA: hypothetical protein VII02_12255 [Gemmatimonadaceae bacterium]|jgi:hypothetical protein
MSNRQADNAGKIGSDVVDEMPRSASLLFAPLDKRAFGAAIGVAAGLVILGITVLDVARGLQPVGGLGLLSQYFAGYSVSFRGALIGLAWGMAVGFCAGWFVAFVRNFVLAVSLFLLRERAELDETRDFLDHI